MSALKASVIIPAYNAKKTISNALNSLFQQTFSEPFEIIVVDDGSTDQTAEIVRTFTKVKLIQQKNAGPAKARNTGAHAAQGDLLVFTDSDCVPEKNWLQQMILPFKDSDIVGVQGAYKTLQKNWMAQFIQLEIEDRYERMKKAKKLDWIGSYSAGYRKKNFIEIQGFDETFSKASGEDADLSYRLQKKRHTLIFNPAAQVTHQHPTTLRVYLKKKFQHAYWRILLYKKHSKKILQDSYTPETLKLQLIFTIVLGFSLIWPIFTQQNTSIFSLMALLFLTASMTPFVLFAGSHNFLLAIVSLPILFLRNIAFIAGMTLGILGTIVRGNSK